MTELAGQLHLSPSGLTRRLDRLVREGLVAREACPTDRRVVYAVLTPAGRELWRQAAPDHVAGVRRHLIDRLDERSSEHLAETLEQVRARPATSPELTEPSRGGSAGGSAGAQVRRQVLDVGQPGQAEGVAPRRWRTSRAG